MATQSLASPNSEQSLVAIINRYRLVPEMLRKEGLESCKDGNIIMMPFQVLGVFFRGILALALIAAGVTCLSLWYRHREFTIVEHVSPPTTDGIDNSREPPTTRTRTVYWQFGSNLETAYLLGGLALLGWSLGGGWLTYPGYFRRHGDAPPDIHGHPTPITRPDGTKIHVEVLGVKTGPTVILTHGWSLNSDEWSYAKQELAASFRTVVWDLPGLGLSELPRVEDLSLESMARDLDLIVDTVRDGPVILLGHSIGGMILLTYCREFRNNLTDHIDGLIIVNSTYTNPLNTTQYAGLMRVLQKPVLEPLAYLMIWLSPLVRLMNWLGYINGSAQRSTDRSSFSGRETKNQLDELTRQYVMASPAVVGKGFLAMFRYDATDILSSINVPALIVTSDGDSTCKPDASAFMAQRIPQATLVTLEGGRHCASFEFHKDFHSSVTSFIRGLGERFAVSAYSEQKSAGVV